jgi:hypothetical protein
MDILYKLRFMEISQESLSNKIKLLIFIKNFKNTNDKIIHKAIAAFNLISN